MWILPHTLWSKHFVCSFMEFKRLTFFFGCQMHHHQTMLLCSPCFCHCCLSFSASLFIFQSDEVWRVKVKAQMLSPATLAAFVFLFLFFLFLWFVTRHPSPPTSFRFWSALGWLVIMLMQLCSFKVSAPSSLLSNTHRRLHFHLPHTAWSKTKC